jgi:hypothetical protein
VEVVTPGPGAVMPAAFEAVVHGVDNVVLHQVDLYLNGVLFDTMKQPYFTIPLDELGEGPHFMWAVGTDAHGNQGTSGTVDFTVKTNCAGLGNCVEGLDPVGLPCVLSDDCQSKLCATATVDASAICSKTCQADSPCLEGSQCVTAANAPSGYCTSSTGPVVRLLEAESPFALRGCATVPTSDLPAGFVLGLVLFFWLRRRA